MVQVMILTFLAMTLIVGAMAIGIAMGRSPIRGSCGGVSAAGLGNCEICGGNPERCDEDDKGLGRAA